MGGRVYREFGSSFPATHTALTHPTEGVAGVFTAHALRAALHSKQHLTRFITPRPPSTPYHIPIPSVCANLCAKLSIFPHAHFTRAPSSACRGHICDSIELFASRRIYRRITPTQPPPASVCGGRFFSTSRLQCTLPLVHLGCISISSPAVLAAFHPPRPHPHTPSRRLAIQSPRSPALSPHTCTYRI